jgi:hypothetical protein
MPLPVDYIELLEILAIAFSRYRERSGASAVLVGGAATAIVTAGSFMSGDFDVVAADDTAFDDAMLATGFLPEDRLGHLLRGFYHPGYPAYGVELVSGPLFDGRSDPAKLIRMILRDGELVLPSIEDLVADRLGQHAIAPPSDDSRLRQARVIFTMAKEVDMHYLRRRVLDEGGDPDLLDATRRDDPKEGKDDDR